MRIVYLCYFVLLMAVSTSVADTKAEEFAAILRRVAQSGDAVIASPPSAGDVAGWKLAALTTVPEFSLPAILKLWVVGGQQDFVRLVWWRKRNNARAGRMMVVALYECATKEPISAKPSFVLSAKRFDEEEESAREEEFDFIVSHRRELAGLLVELVKTTDVKLRSDEANLFLGHYENMAFEQK